ncbi:hypothetical protein N657DRAFT_648620 [Parathielavia appendiculata]|uniref:Uncharacterized protein n=1 Tax=Parathielavia appendiculata TaxID=2587402 RepID=A0AAN6TVQ5_9PEZI|nr:hypothetical protein N657DRAFT_648620 [Parathielavia appendiculata]
MEMNTSQGSGIAPTQRGDSDVAFKKFDSYPWARDRSFLQGLMATLGPSLLINADGFNRQKALSTTLQARIWWYKSRFNTDIDRAAYEAYSASHPLSSPDGSILAKLEEIQQRMGGAGGAGGTGGPSSASSQSQNIPAWQLNAPKVDLSKKADDGASHANTGDGAPYPENFQALIEAVTTGKPIPGIKEIPNTVVRPPGVTPFGKMKAPRKPWEKEAAPDSLAQAGVFGNVVDKEFPPLPSERSN